MAFVDHDEIVVSPVNLFNGEPYRRTSSVSGQVGMIGDIVAESVFCKRIINKISTKRHPVCRELFRAENKDVFIAPLVILDYRERGKGFTESDTVREDTSVILLQLIDNRERRVFLKIVEFVPNHAGFKAGGFVGEHVFGDIFKEFTEDVIERHKVN